MLEREDMNLPDRTPIDYFAGKDRLPKVSRMTKKLLLLYNLGLKQVQPWLSRSLGFSDKVTFNPGVSFSSGQIICAGVANLGDTLFVDYAPVYIGENSGFSFRNCVVTSTHDMKNFKRIIAKPVIIERNVWITTNVTILGGVRIGENSVIGAGSVVTRDIPPNVFAVGNPCKPVRKISRG